MAQRTNVDFATPAGIEGRYSYTDAQAESARLVLAEVVGGLPVDRAVRNHPLPGGEGHLRKSVLVSVYRNLVEAGKMHPNEQLLAAIRMKPLRTLSGVATVTVLTKPYPCPGRCVFCPTDTRLPKSYLADEPGAMRALHHEFDPYTQTVARREALAGIGHPTDKIELLVLGGTFSAYRRDYQEWFVRRCFDALNGFDSDCLEEAFAANELTTHRNVGLVIETRPDHVDTEELEWLRRLGVTKVQMGLQSADDSILNLNNRGHDVDTTRAAMTRLRAYGFKVVLHWMPNLLGATPESDREDFGRIFDDSGLRPDELKIYPCQLLENAELYDYWKRGEYVPYTTDELCDLLADVKARVPRYCRVNRVIRDIPSVNVVEGNRRTNLRQDVHSEMGRRGTRCDCIRCREVGDRAGSRGNFIYVDERYETSGSSEHFISANTADDRIAGYVRLSLPDSDQFDVGHDLAGAAIIREVHVYGQSLEVGSRSDHAAQHNGIGAELVERSEAVARRCGYGRLAVIAASGTRGYYKRFGYLVGKTYMLKSLTDSRDARDTSTDVRECGDSPAHATTIGDAR